MTDVDSVDQQQLVAEPQHDQQSSPSIDEQTSAAADTEAVAEPEAVSQSLLPPDAGVFNAAIDYRSSFIGDLVLSSLDAPIDAWRTFVDATETKAALNQFLESASQGTALFLHFDGSALTLAGAQQLPQSSDNTNTSNGSDVAIDSDASHRSLYILKSFDGSVPKPMCFSDLSSLSNYIEYGTLPGHSLLVLEHLIKDVFLPLADPDTMANDSATKSLAGDRTLTTASKLGRATTSVDDGEGHNDEMRSELSSNMQKFASQLQHAIAQVNGKITLPVPATVKAMIDGGNDWKALATDSASVSVLESCLDEWITIISQCLEQEHRKKPLGPNPLAEIQFWRDRNATLSSLYEQLQFPIIKATIELSERLSLSSMELFEKSVSELLKCYTEAKDNVKFLVTLERHFKNLSSGSLSTILDTIPSMMNSLRMVWIISRHYNKDQRMFPLMERIARCLAEKVGKELNIRTLFRREPSDAIRVVNAGRAVLEAWHSNYMLMREKIESSGTDRRWEFNRAQLFDQTSYMIKISQYLLDIAQTIEQFSTFLGPELKAVTGDVHGIDEVNVRVKALIRPLEHLNFSIFDPRFSQQWDEQIKAFRLNVDEIESKTRIFIDSSFQKLRSAEGAFDLLQNFRLMESRESIQKQMMMKFTDILIQFSKEIERIRKIFEAGQSQPPVAKHAPPVSGAIGWLRSLYYRIKRSVLRFQSMPKLLESEQGKAVCREYVALARAITQQETKLVSEWRERVIDSAQKRLKEFILKFEDGQPLALPSPLLNTDSHIGSSKSEWEEKTTMVTMHSKTGNSAASSVNGSFAISKQFINASKSSSSSSTARKVVGDSSAQSTARANNANNGGVSSNSSYMRSSRMAPNGKTSLMKAAQAQASGPRAVPDTKFINRRIIVNFSSELLALISESKALDRMGIPIPEIARSVCLQERKYYDLCEQLQAMLANYETVIGKLNTVEKQLLCHRIADLLRIMAPGFEPINWNSLSIPSFIEACQRGIAALETLVNSGQKNSSLINKLIGTIKRATLVDLLTLQSRSNVYSVEELNDKIEHHRSKTVESLVGKYTSMSPLLRIIELHVAEAETGRSEVMYEYYRYWEKRAFTSVTQCIAQGMKDFQSLLLQHSTQSLPLIQVMAEMSPPNLITVTPNIQDIYKLLSKLLRNIPESSKNFIRWMAGTCIECQPIQVNLNGTNPNSHSSVTNTNSEEETILYSFYDDLSKNPVIVPLMLTVTQSIQRTIHGVDKFIDGFALYHQRYQLWNPKKLAALERFRTKANVPTSYFEKQMEKYSSLTTAILTLPRYHDIDFIRIDCSTLIEAIRAAAESWKSKYADILQTQALAQLAAIYSDVSSLANRLAGQTDGIDELKYVLAVIREIHSANLSMELAFASVAEKFAVLERYQIPIDPKDRSRAEQLTSTWQQLLLQAESRDESLEEVKARFKRITAEDITHFRDSIREMRQRSEASGPGHVDVPLESGVELMKSSLVELESLMARKQALAISEKLFNLPPTSFADLYYVEDRMTELQSIYSLYQCHQEAVTKWSAILWNELEAGALNRGIAQFTKDLKKLGDRLGALPAYKKLHTKMTAFKDSVPLLLSLKNDALRDRHWRELMRSTGVKFEMDSKNFTLGSLFAMELHRFKDDINRIVNNAIQEQKIERDIAKLAKQWATESFSLVPFNGDESRGYILSDVSPILQTLEDHALSLQAMANSPFATPFVGELRLWEQRCNHISETLSVWMQVQRKWMYLEGIFLASDDIRMQLPEPAKKFDRVDLSFKKTMSQTNKQPNVLHACSIEHRMEDLRALAAELDKCQKSLSDYLERKRHAFPRFFFISDDELLSILGQSSPLCVQQHMLKLFQNVKELIFNRGESLVTGMSSGPDEWFEFKTPVSTEGAVENWMNAVEAEMKTTLQIQSKEAVFYYPKQARYDWIQTQLGMISIVGSQIWWTWEVENAFARVSQGHKHAMKELAAQLTGQLNDLVTAIRDSSIASHTRKKLNTLIIIDVHARDIIDRFVRDSILDAREFDWESQLRFYWDRQLDDVRIGQCTGEFSFGYEYMGLDGRLVITPLTDRCYMTLTQALTFHMGGSPAGPAGTGKTETVKDLAKALGLPCLVTNCGEGLDFKAMGSIFSGLVQTGAWGCFDEFNRIDVEVLSVVSSQLQTIQAALNANKQRFEFLGKDINLKPSVGFFITMNPGYAGRTELPDNLKALFRPVTMIVPDLLQICEIMLFSEGFTAARLLAKKMTVLYRLAAEQLSKQFHYDFGLRALKSVLVMAGSLKRSSEDLSEELVLMRALRDQNLPKFVFEDVPLFLGLINDLFPSLECQRLTLPSLKTAVTDELTAQGLHHRDEAVFQLQVDKAIQLYETLQTRHTVMLVGPSGGGKSVVLNTLAKSMSSAFQTPVKLHTLNPKACSVSELYGTLDPATRDWTDGLLSKIFRECNEPLKPDSKEYRYIVFDGDVDALWVENMNSVMDDNKLLTLPNGERIRLESHVKLLFEVADLQYASPATVSRCGMVYVDPKNLGYMPYYDRWVRQRTGNDRKIAELLNLLYDKYLPATMDYVYEGLVDGKIAKGGPCQTIIPLTKIALVKQFCAMFSTLLPTDSEKAGNMSMTGMDTTTDSSNDSGESVPVAADTNNDTAVTATASKTSPNRDPEVIESMYVFCLMWSIGGALVTESRVRFDSQVKTLSHRACVQSPSKSQLPEDLLYDYQFVTDSNPPRWMKWEPSAYQPPLPFNFSKILVPTIDTTRYTFLLSSLVQAKTPVLYVGETGTAKTVTVKNYLGGLDLNTQTTLHLNFSSRTSSLDVQLNIESNVDKRTGLIFGPANNKSMVIFYDDLNMPKVDGYGTQQPIALLKFLIDRSCMYDRGVDENSKTERLARKSFRDLLHVAAMAPPGGGRSVVDPRFIALFSVISITNPSDSSLTHIYQSMLASHLDCFNTEIKDLAPKLTNVTIKLYKELCAQLPPTPSKFHYVFNLRDLGRVWQGLMLATPERFTSVESVVRLWRNECLRVFYDRLISDHDRTLVKDKLIDSLTNTHFPNVSKAACIEPSLFGDFGHEDPNDPVHSDNVRLYEDLGSYDRIAQYFNDLLAAYNEDNEKPMDLVLFAAALEHVTRILRIIRMPRGHALLVGVGGSGKQSLTKLATFAARYRLFTINLTRHYSENDFREDLKSLYTSLATGKDPHTGAAPSSGGDGNAGGASTSVSTPSPIVFLFTDAHVKDESFLELINNMLTSGMVPALFTDEEKQPFIDCVRNEVKALGMVVNAQNCWNHFVSKCADNIHLVLCFSPAGDALRRRCRSFPGLVNNTVIDWFFPWPSSALHAVAEKFIGAEDSIEADDKSKIVTHMVKVHTSVIDYSTKFTAELRRQNSVTPKNFLDYIHAYRTQLTLAREENVRQYNRLDGGLTKLIDAGEAVEKYGVELAEKKIIVDAKSKECQAMILQIKERSKEVEIKQQLAAEREAQLVIDNVRINEEKAEAEKALLEAEPELAAAADALLKLKKEDIAEVKVLQKPPASVQLVCQCVLELRPNGNEDPSQGWNAAKVMMNDANFLLKLKTYPKDAITDKQMAKVNKILKKKTTDPKQKLTLENLQRISRASAGLLQWVLAIVNYHRVAKDVEPRRLKVRAMEKAKQKAEEDLTAIQQELMELQAEITQLRKTYTEKSEELRDLEEKAVQMEKHLTAASQLINGLSSEKTRWINEKQKLLTARSKLVGDCLLAASFLSYTGAFTFDYRQKMVYHDWMRDIKKHAIPLTEPFRLEALLTSEVETSKWASEGLPADELSIQNGILTIKSQKFPLCIDPQQQAYRWIKNQCTKGDKELKIRSLNDGDWMRQLELAIQFGNPFLLENLGEELDPVIDPILEKQLIPNGAGFAVVLGDNTVDWNPDFRLYLMTKLSNPKYSPEVAGKCQIINYSVTRAGLEDQLLNAVIGLEREDLQTQREELIQTISRNAITLIELEDNILKELNSSSGNLLDNHILISTLKDAKSKTLSIAEQLIESRATAEEIEKVTSSYRPIAKRGALLFFAMSSISAIDSMYEFSLQAYLDVFRKAVLDTPRQSTVSLRVHSIIEVLTRAVYDYTCTGIFERHKLMFSVAMCFSIMDGEDRINREQLDFFLKGNTSISSDSANDRLKPADADWITEQGWKDLTRLQSFSNAVPEFKDLLTNIEMSIIQWKEWFDLERPEERPMPINDAAKLSSFHSLLLLRCFRPDRVLSAVKNFVVSEMKEEYFVQPPVLQYERIYQQSTCQSPIVFILSPGADPLASLVTLAKSHGYFPAKFKSLALGQGQAKTAERLLEQGYHRGHWIVLENLHLMKSWLTTLDKLLQGLIQPHKEFRLFLTTNPTQDFPLGILQNALKVVTEPPDGLKMNIKATYARLANIDFSECQHPAYRPLVYVLAFFHAVIQERRKYGRWGWNVNYDFSDSDFDVSRRLLSMYLNKAYTVGGNEQTIPWESLRYLIGECMYGGRVTDSYDRRILTTYLEEYYGDYLFDQSQPFAFAKLPSGYHYYLPKEFDTDSISQHIDSLPLDNAPQVFGLHSNAEIAYNTQFVKEMWRNLIDLQPRQATTGTGLSREDYIGKIASDLLGKLPEPFDLVDVRRELVKKIVAAQSKAEKEHKEKSSKSKKKKDDGASTTKTTTTTTSSSSSQAVALPPTTIVLLQELERWNALVHKMHDSLTELMSALRGIVGMSSELDSLASALVNGELPASWRRLAPATEKLLASWMTHFHRRFQQYHEWVQQGSEPKVMWLAGLHIPESYLTALVQSTCRRRKWPLDKSTLFTRVTPYTNTSEITEKLVDGCYVEGLSIEGAAWDPSLKRLVPQSAKQLISELPILQIVPIETNKLKLQNTFKTPVYVTQSRRSAMGVGLVFEADLDTEQHSSHWTLQGTAIVLNHDH